MKNNQLTNVFCYQFIVLLLLLSGACSSGVQEEADTVFLSGKIYTMDTETPWAKTMAIKDGIISYIGMDDEEGKKYIGKNTKVVRLEGRLVLPGLHDAHAHPIMGAEAAGYCQLSGLLDIKDILAAIADYAMENQDAKVILGRGWELPAFPDGNPKKELLDSILPNRPVILSSWDGHNAWVNSKALEMANIDKETPDPKNGRIERDPKTGEPSGTLRETAKRLLNSIMPKKAEGAEIDFLREAQKLANSYGITSMVEATASEAYLKAYKTLDDKGELTLRVVASIGLGREKAKSLKELLTLRNTYDGERVNTNSVKVYADGVPEAKTAALLEPYHSHDDEEDFGILNFQLEELKAILDSLDHEGFQIHIHALGDKAVRVSLDALENLDRSNRHHLAHLQIVHPDDIPRFGALGVTANFQPFWAKADALNVQTIIPLVGEERSKQMYPMGSILRSGGRIVAGSDWPVSTLNPWHAIQVAVTRQLIDGEDESWIPTESVDLPSILSAYTKDAAFIMHQEEKTGTLEIGKMADVIVLDRNIFDIPPSEIHKTQVLLTLLEGEEVHEHEAADFLN